MTVIEEYHRQHKERLARFSEAAIARPVVKAPALMRVAVEAPVQVARRGLDFEYEFAWHLEIAGTELQPTERPRPLSIEQIQIATANHYGVTRLDMLSARRTSNLVRPRQVAMYLAKKLTLRSLPEIGRKFGFRDHTTIHHGVRKIEVVLEYDATLAGQIHAIKQQLQVRDFA